MKKCPYCQEEIHDEAIKCRFCGEFLKKKKKWLGCLWGCLITFAIITISVILFIYLSYWFLKFFLYKVFFSGPRVEHYYSPPFTGQGIEGMFREFNEAFKVLWEKLRDFFNPGSQNYKFTF